MDLTLKQESDCVFQPTFTETDGEHKVGDMVWTKHPRGDGKSWLWVTIKKIRSDKSINRSRYLVRTYGRDWFWTSNIEKAIKTEKKKNDNLKKNKTLNPSGAGT